MKKEKFLTIYAVFDEETQRKLNKIQQEIEAKYPAGSQTRGIPFHISLGSFPVEEKAALIGRIGKWIEELKPFSIELEGLGHFDNQLLYVKPNLNAELEALHQIFEGNYSDGYPWVPHVTLYSQEKKIIQELLEEYEAIKLDAKIVGLQMGEFFPTKIILTSTF